MEGFFFDYPELCIIIPKIIFLLQCDHKLNIMSDNTYTEDNIRSLDWKEHIRIRPGMYIGKLGNGTAPDDGIYILFKEVIDNSIDEFMMGVGKKIEINLEIWKIIYCCNTYW